MTEKIKISLIETNKGQIEGLPKNPRFIKDDKFKKLGYDKSKNVHPTQKPLFLPSEALQNSSNKNDIILDLFGGSTLIACEQLDRTCLCYGI